MSTVRYEAASRIYPGTDIAAVDSLDLDITDGELLVLVGPSGSGKSTALAARAARLAGLPPLMKRAPGPGDGRKLDESISDDETWVD